MGPASIVAAAFPVRPRRALSRMTPISGPESIGPRACWGCPRGLDWLWARGGTCRIGTRGSKDQQRWSTTSTRGTSRTTWAQGLQRFRCILLSIGTRWLAHLWGLTTDQGTLCKSVQVDILGCSARGFTNYNLIKNKK
jgi:hypothetical protein